MDIAVIGAGIAGLSAGWMLRNAGHRVRMFERNYKPGGRMNSRRKAGLVVDHGDRFIQRDSPILREMINECGLQNEMSSIDLPIYNLKPDGSFAQTREEAIDTNRITFADGMLALPEALRRNLGGYYSIGVTRVDWSADTRKFVVHTEPPLRSLEAHADGIIIATPANEALRISEPLQPMLNEAFLEQLRRVEYSGCYTLIAALHKVELPEPLYGIIPPQAPGNTIAWIAFEDLKCQRRGVPGWSVVVIHSTAEAAAAYLKMDDERALQIIYQEARRHVPQLPEAWRWARAKRWDFAHLKESIQPAYTTQYPAAPESVLLEFCGDYREGDGCEAAARSGRLAVQALLAKIANLAME